MEGHRVVICKFPFAPEMGAKPILNGLYMRIPPNVTQKLRRPRADQVFGGRFGRCLRLAETNMAKRQMQMCDILADIVKKNNLHSVLTWGFYENTDDVGEVKGIYLMLPTRSSRAKITLPATRSTFPMRCSEFTTEYPVDTCAEFICDIRKIDA